jgi:hypothetical protein
MNAELSHHLGYEKHDPAGYDFREQLLAAPLKPRRGRHRDPNREGCGIGVRRHQQRRAFTTPTTSRARNSPAVVVVKGFSSCRCRFEKRTRQLARKPPGVRGDGVNSFGKHAAGVQRDHQLLVRAHNPSGNAAVSAADARSARGVGLVIPIESQPTGPEHIRARMGMAFSPLPPVSTSASTFPSAAAREPSSRPMWLTNKSSASAARGVGAGKQRPDGRCRFPTRPAGRTRSPGRYVSQKTPERHSAPESAASSFSFSPDPDQ